MQIIVDKFSYLHQLLISYPLFVIGLLLFGGYFLGSLAKKIGLPVITGYIIAGLILGESVTGALPHSIKSNLNSFTDLSLGIIAITIGGEFSFTKIKRLGAKIIILTFFEALFAFLFVSVTLILFHIDFRSALLLGAISSATAPAATVIIIRELRARGEFIDYLYGIVALDDAVCVLLFSIVFAIITPMLTNSGNADIGHALFEALKHILFSAAIGFTGGILLNLCNKKIIQNTNEGLIISLIVIFIVIALTIIFELSLLIANMMLGATLINLSKKNERIFLLIEPITPPLFALFFILAGAELNIFTFKNPIIVISGILFLISRFAGKYIGITIGGFLTKAPTLVRKYIPFCLFPQAGVAIGLAVLLQSSPVILNSSEDIHKIITNIVTIVLFAVFINELVGPLISRYGIKKGTGV